MKNYWNKCFTSTRVLLLVLLVISSTMLFATIYNNNMESSIDIVPPVEDKDSTPYNTISYTSNPIPFGLWS